jgi:hypothetical protein
MVVFVMNVTFRQITGVGLAATLLPDLSRNWFASTADIVSLDRRG